MQLASNARTGSALSFDAMYRLRKPGKQPLRCLMRLLYDAGDTEDLTWRSNVLTAGEMSSNAPAAVSLLKHAQSSV